MEYCANCGEKLPKDALFCPKCGTPTTLGTASNVSWPSEEMRQAFAKMSVEIEKAFAVAAKEIQVAFQTARENVQKSTQNTSVVCGSCGQTNQGTSAYCFKCGKKIEAAGKEKKA
jgi:predicted amidophosphoribosyltransferase